VGAAARSRGDDGRHACQCIRLPANASAGAAGEIKLPITLPDTASARAQEASAFGRATADLARDKGDLSGREFGQTVSEAARARDKPTPPGKRP